MSDCIFCKIAAGEAPAQVVYRDERATAFRDIHPVAPVHLLIIPNRHIAAMTETSAEDEALLGHLLVVARELAEREGIAANGYRLAINTGVDGAQVVYHLHLHLMGGKKFGHQ
ncbi:MAG: histidine triad nucleotide-binding protein [Anaerolineales bacterium]